VASDHHQPSTAGGSDSLSALLSLASHRCGHPIELSFDLDLIEEAKAAQDVCWARDDIDPEAGPRFRAAMAVICDGRAVCALVAAGAVTPDDGVTNALIDVALAAGQLIKPLEWRAIEDGLAPLSRRARYAA
jgi:hypothetical protein